eukprot:SAG22_NODE_1204_length_5172_cov_4.546028_6_plen_422_part_00
MSVLLAGLLLLVQLQLQAAGGGQVTVFFRNNGRENARLYWQKVHEAYLKAEMLPGRSAGQRTFSGERWLVTTGGGGPEGGDGAAAAAVVMDIVLDIADGEIQYVDVYPGPPPAAGPAAPPRPPQPRPASSPHPHGDGDAEFVSMAARAAALAHWSTERFYADSEVRVNPDGSLLPPPEMFNIAVNAIQPGVIPAITGDGYRVVQTPAGLQRALAAVVKAWEGQRAEHGMGGRHAPWEFAGTSHSLISEFADNGTAMSHKIQVSNSLRKLVIEAYRPLISEWAGGAELDMPVFYGIRYYIGGAKLMRHVDQMTCHGGHKKAAAPAASGSAGAAGSGLGWCKQTDVRVLSAIINIAQDVDEDWPLVINDHSGSPHNVTLSPGQSALYESSRLVHGRPFPLAGRAFANCFVHFKPASWQVRRPA